jgi:hypothetical protein
MTAADILESISLIIAAWTVIIGVNAWRHEFIGKRRIELAEEVLALFYEARDVISYIRSPFGYVGEGSSRKSSENESPEEKQIYDNAYVVVERYNKNQELLNKIYSMRYRFMAQFGKEASVPFDDLRKIVNDIFISSRMLTHHWKDQGRRTWKSEAEFNKHLEEMHKYEAVFWEMSVDDDPIIPRVSAVISNIEDQCNAIIGKKTTLQRLWVWISKLWHKES